MNSLIIREVPFYGSQLLAVQDKATGKIYAGVKWMCEGMGLTRGQKNNESHKIQHDLVLSKGALNLVLPTKGGNQEALCLEIDFVPLWLAKINVTPAMRSRQPELAELLIKYQLEAAKVLSAAFLNKPPPKPEPPALDLDVIKQYQSLAESSDVPARHKDGLLDCLYLRITGKAPPEPQERAATGAGNYGAASGQRYDMVAGWMEGLTLAQLGRFGAMLNARGAVKKRILFDGQVILNVMDDTRILGTEGAFT